VTVYSKAALKQFCLSREIQTAVHLALPGELAKDAVSQSEGKSETITKYTLTSQNKRRVRLFSLIVH